MKSPLRRRLGSAALLLLVPLIAACGFNYQTDKPYQSAAGTENRSGQVYILNAMVVTVSGGKGTFAGTLVNENQTRADKLVSITGPTISGSTTQVSLPPNSAVDLAKTGQITISGPDIKPGNFVPMTFEFANGQSTQMQVPVFSRTGFLANVALPSSSPTGSPSSSPTGSPSATSSPTAPTPSASATTNG